MKKFLLISMAVLCVFGCRNFDEAPTENMYDSDSGRTDSFEILATIGQNDSKTALDDNGYTLKWCDNDSIAVYFSYQADITSGGLYTFYKLEPFVLTSKADTSAGTFKCVSNLLANKDNPKYKPIAAVYPVNGSFFVFNDNSPAYYKNVLANTLVLDSPRDISKGDIRATSSFIEAGYSPTKDNVYTRFSAKCNFKELGTLLDFEITPTADMVKDKDVIRSISLSTQNSVIAGAYTVSFSGEDVEISADDESFSNQTMTINYKDKAISPFQSALPAEFLMTILPGIGSGEKLYITIVTDKRTININTAAAKDFLPGYKYKMSLPLSEIPESNISIIVPDKFTSISDKLGKFSIDKSGNVTTVFSDDESGVQYGYHDNKCRFQNWNDGTITFLTIPAGTKPQVGSTISVTESTLNGSNSPKEFRAVMRVGSRYWLKSTDGTTGYIISIED